MKILISFLALLLCLAPFKSQAEPVVPPENNTIYDATLLIPHPIEEVAETVSPGTIVILSEIHNLVSHHQKQVDFLNALKTAGKTQISVSMEFFEYPYQNLVDQYLKGSLQETEFLSKIGWGSITFDLYKQQVLFPITNQGNTFAINAPKKLTSKISKVGIAALSEGEKQLLPPNFQIGSDLYFERFKEYMGGGHVSPEKMKNYFEAQSTWDDTMAWKILEAMKANPKQIMVVIVGDFHNAYGGGLPDRLNARGYEKVLTISQVNLANSEEPLDQWHMISPDDKWGVRSHLVWTSNEKTENLKSKKVRFSDYFGF